MASDRESRPDLGAVFDEHVRLEFEAKDVAATMRTMVEEHYVWNVPTAVGGLGGEGVRRFYGEQFVGHMPDETAVERISRTVGADQVVDELIISFTHEREIPFMSSRSSASGRRAGAGAAAAPSTLAAPGERFREVAMPPSLGLHGVDGAAAPSGDLGDADQAGWLFGRRGPVGSGRLAGAMWTPDMPGRRSETLSRKVGIEGERLRDPGLALHLEADGSTNDALDPSR